MSCSHIRWMIRRDMPRVLEIERECFEFAWTEDDFIRCLRQNGNIGMVIELKDVVAGFMIYQLHRTRIHLLSIAVDPGFQDMYLGADMVEKLKSKLKHQNRKRITLEIRETNLAAQLFFRSMGFRCVHTLKNFYADSNEDAYVFSYKMPIESSVWS